MSENTSVSKKSSWYDNKVIVIALLVVFFPVGLYGMWQNKQFTNKTKWIVSGIFALLIVLSGAGKDKKNQSAQPDVKVAQTSSQNQENQTQVSEPATQKEEPEQSFKTEEPKPEVSKAVESISFADIKYNMTNMTELQFKEYVKSLEGKTIRWNGWVEEVEEKLFGGYRVLIDMDSPSDIASVQDITFEVPKEQAISLKKDEMITFEGKISSILNILTSLQVSLDNARIVK